MMRWASDNCSAGWSGLPSGGYGVALEMMRDPNLVRDMIWEFVSEEECTMFRMVWQ
jgi:hypothetical protein